MFIILKNIVNNFLSDLQLIESTVERKNIRKNQFCNIDFVYWYWEKKTTIKNLSTLLFLCQHSIFVVVVFDSINFLFQYVPSKNIECRPSYHYPTVYLLIRFHSSIHYIILELINNNNNNLMIWHQCILFYIDYISIECAWVRLTRLFDSI